MAKIVIAAVFLGAASGFFYVRHQVSLIGDSIDKQISSLIDSGISADVAIDWNKILPQTIKINQDVPINKTFHVEKEIEVKTTVPIKGDQRVTVNLNVPFYGAYPVEVPFSLDMDIPVSLKVPVSLDIPVNDNFKVNLEIPLKDALNIDPGKKMRILPVNFSAQSPELRQRLEEIQEVINLIRKIFLIPQKTLTKGRESL